MESLSSSDPSTAATTVWIETLSDSLGSNYSDERRITEERSTTAAILSSEFSDFSSVSSWDVTPYPGPTSSYPITSEVGATVTTVLSTPFSTTALSLPSILTVTVLPNPFSIAIPIISSESPSSTNPSSTTSRSANPIDPNETLRAGVTSSTSQRLSLSSTDGDRQNQRQTDVVTGRSTASPGVLGKASTVDGSTSGPIYHSSLPANISPPTPTTFLPGEIQNSGTPLSASTPTTSDGSSVNAVAAQEISTWRNRVLAVSVLAGLEALVLLLVFAYCLRKRHLKGGAFLQGDLPFSKKKEEVSPYAQIHAKPQSRLARMVGSSFPFQRTEHQLSNSVIDASRSNAELLTNPFADPPEHSSYTQAASNRPGPFPRASSSTVSSAQRASSLSERPISRYSQPPDDDSSQHSVLLPITFRHSPPTSYATVQSRSSLSTCASSRETYTRDPFGEEYNPVDANRPFGHRPRSSRTASAEDDLYPSGPEGSRSPSLISTVERRRWTSLSAASVGTVRTPGQLGDNG